MSGGIVSYPRTSAGEPPESLRLARLLQTLEGGGAGAADAIAKEIVRSLIVISAQAADHVAMAMLARRVRDRLFVALVNGVVKDSYYAQAMAVCADHWRLVHPIASTSLGQAAQIALDDLEAATHETKMRLATERVGTIAALYQMCALAGDDLGPSHFDTAQPIADTGYVEAKESDGQTIFFQAASSYNVNVFVALTIPGASKKLVIVLEAKGGGSNYSKVAGPKAVLKRLKRQSVSQRERAYAFTRADYMARHSQSSPQAVARRAVGEAIRDAYWGRSLVYAAVRGRRSVNGIESAMEVLDADT